MKVAEVTAKAEEFSAGNVVAKVTKAQNGWNARSDVKFERAVGWTSESQVAAARAVNVVGTEAQLVAVEGAVHVGLTSESQIAAERAVNLVGAEANL